MTNSNGNYKPRKIRTVVFGSTFGQFYLEALSNLSDDFEIKGLIASGSERSKKCAEAYGIPLFNDIREIDPNDIDLACIILRSGVMGGKGTEFALYCMANGIHVIQEHPIHHKDLTTCLRVAKSNQVHFTTGNLYIHLPAFRRFTEVAKHLFETKKVVYLDIALATQVSFPLVQMMIALLPNPRPLKIHHVLKDSGPFQVLTGEWGGLPFTLRAHNEVNPNDPDNHQHLLHTISIGCSGGTLSLTDTHGPVVWKTQLHIPHNELLKNVSPEHQLTEKSTLILGPEFPPSYQEILQKQWPRAIGKDLQMIKSFITGEKKPEQRAHLELLCTQLWHDLTHALGAPQLRPDALYQHVEVSTLKELADKIPAEPEETSVY
ncbi:Gfo/Idh/MocA family oxidoreductase [Flavobacterium poyangense]|uniref:Gfo/Idh/MocA family oxidoreductase n=1 Tax=Flavobacterium poyangense TaxID=2204302 RepID=UPI00141F6A34|nr:Gfo/Idh/MocA family oxidoreductase [Flavobacterium sp. JXAS1]